MHKRSLKSLAGHRVEIPINQRVVCDGSSLWIDTNNLIVTVKDITIESRDEYGVFITVYHDAPEGIYTDKGFKSGISQLISEEVGQAVEVRFTEQGMQRENMASMETDDTISEDRLLEYIKLMKGNY